MGEIANRMSDSDAAEWFDLMINHFGLPADVFEGFTLTQPNPKTLYVVNSDCDCTASPKTVTVGIPFVRINMAVPKPTTAAVFWFGAKATQNFIELEEDHLDDYFRRADVHGDGELPEGCHPGYIVVRFRGIAVGVGYLHVRDGHWRFENMHPKVWKLGEQASSVSK